MADDVAEDYRQALEDLQMNSRLEISTLTNIARENADHGLAIAEVLTAHIKKVPPARTLPALYVLDSVVKNVPTPYGLYFGPKLYSIFMGAYTKVDNATRRKMDEMLKTWKEPVPGSISTKPVFPPEFVRPIENALMAARNVAFAAQQNSFQGQQQLLRRGPPSAPPNRDTPTPPNVRPSSYQSGLLGQQPFPGPPNGQNPPDAYPMRPHNGPPRPVTQPPPSAAGLPHYPQQPAPREVYGALPQQQQPGIIIDKLRDDIQQLIVVERAEFARDPHDTSKQTRLLALLDLQTLIQRPDVPRDQLMLVRDRVAELAVNMRAAPPQQPPVVHHHVAGTLSYTPTPTPPVALPPHVPGPQVTIARPSSAQAVAVAARPPSAAGAAAPNLSIDSLFGQGALATLLGGIQRNASTPTQAAPAPVAAVSSASSTPQPPVNVPLPPPAVMPKAAIPAVAAVPARTTPPQTQAAAEPPAKPAPATVALASSPGALLAMLRQSGLLGGGSAGVAPATVPPVPRPLPVPVVDIGPFSRAALKQYRPWGISRLHDDLGPPCTQCGRRFRNDDAGRRKKTAHMDWHFRVHQRIAEAEKRGQHRSWYVGEDDWIKSREAIDVDYVAPDQSGGDGSVTGDDGDGELDYGQPSSRRQAVSGGSASNKKKIQYIPVPDDSSRVNNICPICQEQFEMKWLDEAQEWVWMDAIRVGDGRVYHATCHREATGGDGNGNPGYATGGNVLGKRKAEDDFPPEALRGKLKMESGY